MDVMGQKALLHSWSLVLGGKAPEVPELLGAWENAVCAAAETSSEKKEEFELGTRQLVGRSKLWLGLRFAWDLLWSRPVETHTIFLPKQFVAKLKRQILDEINAMDLEAMDAFVSEGDILTAWAIRAIASSLQQPRPVTALHALNMRFRLASLTEAAGVYVQNMAVAGFKFLSSEAASGPLGHIALLNRRHLKEQSTEAQTLAFVRELRQHSTLGGDPSIICGDPDAVLVPFTNWTKAEFHQTADFSPAIVHGKENDNLRRPNPPGSITFHHAQSVRRNPAARNVFVIMGKDFSDNYWLTGTLHPPAWATLEQGFNVV